ncbi:phage tail protein [Novosphingopyxis iocasae]|uniref:phage tail protein n=1 Tax=Novosphingopyxis iocasae TaxID=2762729 RepID=UPI001651088A|nr:phage tail protein [Novosphingopyxis iocasae]
MATIVFNAVGFALGGPIGAALGSLAGRALDQTIFGGPKGREGPRLKELDVQTSSYGSEIPAMFGTMRVAGTVIWATPLNEHVSSDGGGKSRPSQTNYSYSASLAVALSSRPAAQVGRIWADGNLLRGAGGDFKVETGFRFHTGHGDQTADPLIAQAEGAEAPAFRGIAFAVFEDLQLADYGNRIPSLSFELIERDGSVRLVEIAREASASYVDGDAGDQVGGFALAGSARDAVSLIAESAALRLSRDMAGYRFDDEPVSIGSAGDPVIAIGREAVDRPQRSRAPLANFPAAVELRYYDPARDYQAGLQRARRSGGGQDVRRLDFPAAMDADGAAKLAETLARRSGAEREQLRIAVPYGEQEPRAGRTLAFGGAIWAITEVEHRRGAMMLTARALGARTPITATAVPGRAIREVDEVHGPTTLRLVELPDITRRGVDRPFVAVAANGAQAGWRRAALSIGPSIDALRPIGPTSPAAVMGVLETPLARGSFGLVDVRQTVIIHLIRDDLALRDADPQALFTGANLASIGGEVVQFERAVALGGGRYRIERLHRGLFGSAANGATVGAVFLLLEIGRMRLLDEPEIAAGLPLVATAVGVGDTTPAVERLTLDGRATLPLAPVHLTAISQADGALNIGWVRRSRIGADWSLQVEPPLGEDVERYRIAISGAGGVSLVDDECAGPAYAIASATVVAWREHGRSPIRIAVRQIGRHGPSTAAEFTYPL